MKTSQIVGAIVALAAMVFLVTFAMNYFGKEAAPDPGGPGGEEYVSLYFPQNVFPPPPVPAGESEKLMLEVDDKAGHNFWFVNPSDKAVKVGLIQKNCSCSAVQLAVVPKDGVANLVAGFAGRVGTLGTDPLARLTAGLGAAWPTSTEAEALVRPVDLFEYGSAEIPPRGVGWLRLGWVGRQEGPQTLHADFWIDDMRNTPVRLQAQTLAVRPLIAGGEVLFRVVDTSELPLKGETICWSSTRQAFDLKARLLDPRGGDPASDPLVVGDPVPLSAEEYARLSRSLNAQQYNGPILCAYKIPVTVQSRSPDGKTPFDVGPFHRRILLRSPDPGMNPQEVPVRGRIIGEVQVEGAVEGGLPFGSFQRKLGSKRLTIVLRTAVPAVKAIEIEERTADFLEIDLPKEPESQGGTRTWRVQVQVRPGEARGPFPRVEDPRYRDSALYLKILSDNPRSIRIPVTGTANEG